MTTCNFHLSFIVSSIILYSLPGIINANPNANITNKPDRPNILFIAADDLRPELNCYGKSHIKSPNIDRLAKMGTLFKNAYASKPSCGPSRASLLSGVYPSQIRFVPWNCSLDEDLPGVVSLPMHFRNNHYYTVSLGKIFNNFEDSKGSWDEIWRPPVTTTSWDYQSKRGIEIFERLNKGRNSDLKSRNNKNMPKPGIPYEKPDVRDNVYADGRIANKAIETLQNLQNQGQPFFLAVGFYKPHIPFNAPLKYWELYDENEIKFPENDYFPKNAPDAAKFNWSRSYYGTPKEGPLPDTMARNQIHGYYACVSFIDAQIGRIINELESLGLAENTIIVLWGDHGHFLLEHGFWHKYCNFKLATNAPLIVKVPWKTPNQESSALIEFIDIYPSLCDLAGLSKPFHLQGKSFGPLLDQPEQPWKEAAFSRAGRGETIFTKTHAYTEYINPETGETYARMLYDHRVDPEENNNVSELPENQKLIETLHEKLQRHLKERDIIPLPIK